MSYSRPTLAELTERIRSDFASRLGTNVLRRSIIWVLVRVYAGIAHLLYGYLDWIARQIMPDTAESSTLRRLAAIFGILPTPATFASGNIVISGNDGSEISADETEFIRDDGVIYRVTETVAIVAGQALCPVICTVAGSAGNLEAGGTLTLSSSIAGVQPTATVDDDGITGGEDAETDSSLLSRLLDRIQSPPHGGAENDYKKWAREVAGVTRVWVYPNHLGPGTVGVAFVQDDKTPSIIPDETKVGEVQAYIDDPSRAPVVGEVTVFAPIAAPLNLTIELNPDSPAIRTAVTAELQDMLRRTGNAGATTYLSKINEAISLAAGEDDHILHSPLANVTHGSTEVPVLGTITWS